METLDIYGIDTTGAETTIIRNVSHPEKQLKTKEIS